MFKNDYYIKEEIITILDNLIGKTRSSFANYYQKIEITMLHMSLLGRFILDANLLKTKKMVSSTNEKLKCHHNRVDCYQKDSK